jgi:outer membrane protein OmpA-like peptidoglycan-associated protein
MKMNRSKWIAIFIAEAMVLAGASLAFGQTTQYPGSAALININTSRTTEAVGYRDRTSTKIDFQGTSLMPRAIGEARVDARDGRVAIKAELKDLSPATSIGSAYLTYVLWAISPEGRANNLGEVLLESDGKAKLEVTTKLQTFALIVTAEPYYAVSYPSELVVMENIVRGDTKGTVTTVDAKFDLLQRGAYDSLQLTAYPITGRVPLFLYEARNAVRIAQADGADHYAADSLSKAQTSLIRAEDYEMHHDRKSAATAARDAVQAAEDARTLTIKRRQDEYTAQQQQEANDATARAQSAQQDEAARRMDAERRQMRAEVDAANEAKARAEAEAQRQAALVREQQATASAQQANAAAAQSAQQADAASQQAALANQQAAAANEQAAQAQAQAAQSEQEKRELRARLLNQLNLILETRDTARGLVVNVGDVLFDTARYSLRPGAREALAKVSGIVLAYPGLRLTIEGHTDSVGTQDFNQRLSEERAGSVRDYLVQQGLSVDNISAVGLGEAVPVADNGTPEGRQRNRRVEIIVSGDVIGASIGPN